MKGKLLAGMSLVAVTVIGAGGLICRKVHLSKEEKLKRERRKELSTACDNIVQAKDRQELEEQISKLSLIVRDLEFDLEESDVECNTCEECNGVCGAMTNVGSDPYNTRGIGNLFGLLDKKTQDKLAKIKIQNKDGEKPEFSLARYIKIPFHSKVNEPDSLKEKEDFIPAKEEKCVDIDSNDNDAEIDEDSKEESEPRYMTESSSDANPLEKELDSTDSASDSNVSDEDTNESYDNVSRSITTDAQVNFTL